MEIPQWMLAVGAGGISAPGIWAGLKWVLGWFRGQTEATRKAEADRVAAIAEREDRAYKTLEQALGRLDADVKRLSAITDMDRERIANLERENRTLRSRLDWLDSAVRVALSRLQDLIRWEEQGMPPPPPWSFKSIADLLTEDKNR